MTADITTAQYLEINAIGIVLAMLMYFYIKSMHQASDNNDLQLFGKMLLCNAVILAADCLIFMLSGDGSPLVLVINHFVCIVYYLLHAYFGYVWLKYCLTRLYPERRLAVGQRIACLLPLIISSATILSSPFTGWIYYFTDDNSYSRGPFMWVVILLSYLYWIASAAFVAFEMKRQRRNRERSLYLSLLLFPVPTIIGTAIQLRLFGLSLIWICTVISLLILFVDLQNRQLSRDPLTGLYNRRQTNKQLSWEISHLSTGDALYLIMIDIDRFKQINDECGHIEGDRALVCTAELLSRNVAGGGFLGRYGGDEFVIIGRAKSKQAVEELICGIEADIDLHNRTQPHKYTLSLSMGYAIFDAGSSVTLDSIISAADREMYRAKENHKTAE